MTIKAWDYLWFPPLQAAAIFTNYWRHPMYESKNTWKHLILFWNATIYLKNLISPKFSCRPWWTPSKLNRRSGEWGSFSSILRYRLGTRTCQAFNAFSLILFPAKLTGAHTARTSFSCAHLMPARTFASTLRQCGIAALFKFFCFPSIPAQILELSATTASASARSCPCCGSMMRIYPVLNNSKLF